MSTKKFAETPAAVRRLDDFIQSGKPFRRFRRHFPENGFEYLGQGSRVTIAIFQAGWTRQREVLNEQEIDFVPIGRCAFRFAQKVRQGDAEVLRVSKRCSLEKLPELMNLDTLVHGFEPRGGLRDGFLARGFNASLKIGTDRCLDNELPGQGGIQGVQEARFAPLLCQLTQIT
jgi:hypothetical protein